MSYSTAETEYDSIARSITTVTVADKPQIDRNIVQGANPDWQDITEEELTEYSALLSSYRRRVVIQFRVNRDTGEETWVQSLVLPGLGGFPDPLVSEPLTDAKNGSAIKVTFDQTVKKKFKVNFSDNLVANEKDIDVEFHTNPFTVEIQ